MQLNKKFDFWFPIQDIKKAKDKDGNEVMRVKGIASTHHKDTDDEELDPNGFNLKPFLSTGLVNYHHQQKNTPKAIIGEPTVAKITKAGMYVECDLYPSSPLAQDVFDQMKIMQRDSKTRRMGFSIEGHATERDPLNEKKVLKADITGLAITPQPKNGRTFAEIIKAMNTGEDLEETEEEKEKNKKDKATDTENASALKKESVDDKLKTLTKAEVYEKIFSDFPGIEIGISKQIFKLTEKISNMSKKQNITEDDIKKAYGALGVDSIEKSDESNPFEDGDEDDEKEEKPKKKPAKKKMEKAKPAPEEDDEDESDEEDEEEEAPAPKPEKKKNEKPAFMKGKEETETTKGGILGEIKKAIDDSRNETAQLFRAIGTIVKAQQTEISNLKSIIKAQDNTLGDINDNIVKANDAIEELGESTPGRKSLTKARERNFNEASKDGLEKAGEGNATEKGVVSKTNRIAVLDILDKKTFEKGFDDEFSLATRNYEATGALSANVITRLKNENGITIK
jgi:hypothetical protein